MRVHPARVPGGRQRVPVDLRAGDGFDGGPRGTYCAVSQRAKRLSDRPTHPTEVSQETTWFDRLADAMSQTIARAPFFLACVAIVVVWAVAGPFVHFTHGWVDALEIASSLVTFLIVALLENESWRGGKATQRKLNAIAAALADLMEKSEVGDDQVEELHAAVGLEKRESSTR